MNQQGKTTELTGVTDDFTDQAIGFAPDRPAWRHIVADEAGQRIDNFLVRLAKGVPKSHVYQILRSGQVRVNKGRVDASYRLATGDVLRLPPLRIAATPATLDHTLLPSADCPVVFEDSDILVLNKPSGVAVHGGSGIALGVIEQARKLRPQLRFLELAHRLDKDTSGLLVLAKKRAALTGLHALFRDGGVEKHYLALALGHFRNPKQHVRVPLEKTLDAQGERRVIVSASGKSAHTVIHRLAANAAFSLLDVALLSGRTHQIRVHLAHLGHPLAGDVKYGNAERNKVMRRTGLSRMFLHAASLRFLHPISQKPLHFRAELPAELCSFLTQIGFANALADGRYTPAS